jgi:hypothetical protein
VHIEVAHTLCGVEYALHYLFVVHAFFSLNKTVKPVKELLVAVIQGLGLSAQGAVAESGCGILTLGHQKLNMTERVFDIEQFFGTHFLSPRHYYPQNLPEKTCAVLARDEICAKLIVITKKSGVQK